MARSLPHLDDAVSGRGDDEALRGLEGGDVRDDVMMTHREGLRAAAGRVLGGAALLLAVDLLQRQEGVGSEPHCQNISQTLRSGLDLPDVWTEFWS